MVVVEVEVEIVWCASLSYNRQAFVRINYDPRACLSKYSPEWRALANINVHEIYSAYRCAIQYPYSLCALSAIL